MNLHKEEVYLLRIVAYKERDLILEFFGPETGRFSAVMYRARGGGDPFLFQPGDLLEVEYRRHQHQDLVRLVSTSSVQLIHPDRLSYAQFVIHSFTIELLLKAVPLEAGPSEIYLVYQKALDIGLSQGKGYLGLLYFLVHLSFASGYGLDLNHCARCGKETCKVVKDLVQFRKQTYRLDSGGLVCASCTGQQEKLDGACLKAVYLTQQPDFLLHLPLVPLDVLIPVISQLEDRLTLAMGIQLKSSGLLNRLFLVQGVE